MEEIKEEVKTEEVKAEEPKAGDSKLQKIKCRMAECARDKKKMAILAVVVLVIAGGASYAYNNGKKYINKDEAKKKIESLIPAEAEDTKVTKVALETLYRVDVDVAGNTESVYVSRDGKNFIQGVISFEEIEAQKKMSEEAQVEKEIAKSDKPVVDIYVMSFCPYGNKAEDTLKPVYDLLKKKADFNFRYIVNSNGDKIESLHGEPEVIQNEREACVLKNYGKDQWMNFATYVNKNCGSDGACWEAGAKSLKMDTGKINACVKSEGVALMKAEEKASNDAGATGSPTMLINGTETRAVYQYGNSEAYKQAICGAFNTAPEECVKVLGAATETAEGGSCN